MVVDVFQDIACPWCRIGKKNLTDAIARWDGEPIQVRYRAYFLNDQIPSGGYEFKSYMHAKGGGQVALETFFDGPRLRGYGRAPRDYAGGRQARDLLYFEMSVAIGCIFLKGGK